MSTRFDIRIVHAQLLGYDLFTFTASPVPPADEWGRQEHIVSMALPTGA
jgi:hypothetical protein